MALQSKKTATQRKDLFRDTENLLSLNAYYLLQDSVEDNYHGNINDVLCEVSSLRRLFMRLCRTSR